VDRYSWVLLGSSLSASRSSCTRNRSVGSDTLETIFKSIALIVSIMGTLNSARRHAEWPLLALSGHWLF